MSTTGPLRRTESWVFTISRDETDAWPDQNVPYSQTGALFRPEHVHVHLDRDARQPNLTVTGWRLKGDGTPGRSEVRVHWHEIGKLRDTAWLGEVVNHWRKVLGLGPGTTGVSWS
jgi:hypothetical protein